jgi:hypothetical protein
MWVACRYFKCNNLSAEQKQLAPVAMEDAVIVDAGPNGLSSAAPVNGGGAHVDDDDVDVDFGAVDEDLDDAEENEEYKEAYLAALQDDDLPLPENIPDEDGGVDLDEMSLDPKKAKPVWDHDQDTAAPVGTLSPLPHPTPPWVDLCTLSHLKICH